MFGEPTTQLAFAIHENRGVFALLLGSGMSRVAEIPTGWEITIDLVRKIAMAEGESEIETAKLNSVDPQAWLTDVLGRIADHKITRLDELLPWRYAASAA